LGRANPLAEEYMDGLSRGVAVEHIIVRALKRGVGCVLLEERNDGLTTGEERHKPKSVAVIRTEREEG
jgi:hypothetical protein